MFTTMIPSILLRSSFEVVPMANVAGNPLPSVSLKKKSIKPYASVSAECEEKQQSSIHRWGEQWDEGAVFSKAGAATKGGRCSSPAAELPSEYLAQARLTEGRGDDARADIPLPTMLDLLDKASAKRDSLPDFVVMLK